MPTTDKYREEFVRIFNQPKKGPYGCKCQTLSQRMTGDGCDECNPELAAELEKDND